MKPTYYHFKKDPGMCLTTGDLAQVAGVTRDTMYQRLRHLSVEEAVRDRSKSCLCGCGKKVSAGKYHSIECRRNHYQVLKESGQLEPYDRIPCLNCHIEFDRFTRFDGRKPVGRFCCNSCKGEYVWALRRKKKKITRVCKLDSCNKSFTVVEGSPQLYCCTTHKDLAYRKRPEKKKINRAITCIKTVDGRKVHCKYYDNWLDNNHCDCVGWTRK
jgi:hypothetical protein